MRAGFIGLGLALALASAAGAERPSGWILVSENASIANPRRPLYSNFVGTQTIVREGQAVRFELLTVYADRRDPQVEGLIVEYDCAARSGRMTGARQYDRAGAYQRTVPIQVDVPAPNPGTALEGITGLACRDEGFGPLGIVVASIPEAVQLAGQSGAATTHDYRMVTASGPDGEARDIGFVDLTTIRRQGDFVSARLLTVSVEPYAAPNGLRVDYSFARNSYDCVTSRSAILTFSVFDDHGAVSMQGPNVVTEPQPIPPGTRAEFIRATLCNGPLPTGPSLGSLEAVRAFVRSGSWQERRQPT